MVLAPPKIEMRGDGEKGREGKGGKGREGKGGKGRRER
jgi:hypothetical protein